MPTTTDDLPPSGAGAFARDFPQVWEAYGSLGKAGAEAGPLQSRMRRLIELALSIGPNSGGAVQSHARQALDEGLSAVDLLHVAVLSITTLGFPAAMAGLSRINDAIEGR